MNRWFYLPIAAAGLLIMAMAGCTTHQSLFSKRTPHEQYTANISSARLNHTLLGRAWSVAAESALKRPLTITLPYKESGYFAASETPAAGYRFSARRGDQIEIEYFSNPGRNARVFVDLWKLTEDGSPQWVAAFDTSGTSLTFEAKNEASFVLRLQPELLASTDFTISIKTAPSLGFPVSGTYHPRIGSFWGDQRDAGARSHEGLDIFGAFRTPVIAAADGMVTSVSLNRLGGKVVFMRPSGKDYALYYAHLDSQVVEEGQRVRVGDTLGLMGNTGNAKNTPTHLHFGIYAAGGAIDPLPFINRNRPIPTGIKADTTNIGHYMRLSKKGILFPSPVLTKQPNGGLDKNTVVFVKAATGDWYRVQLPDSSSGFMPGASLARLHPLRTAVLTTQLAMLDLPADAAAKKIMLEKGARVEVLGTFGKYLHITFQQQNGWVPAEAL